MKNTIWLASYPKSGNTWFRMFLSNYLNEREAPASLHDIHRASIASDAVVFEEFTGLNPFELYGDEADLYRPDLYRIQATYHQDEKIPSFRKVHDAYTVNQHGVPLFPSDISLAALYFIRNPLDVCVSFANHSASKLESKLKTLVNEQATMAGKRNGQLRQRLLSWSLHVMSWTSQSDIPVHVIRYEDLLEKPFETFSGAVRFCGLPDDEEKVSQAIQHASFDRLRKEEEDQGFNEKMQLCEQFFWKGQSGYYREYLSAGQIQQIIDTQGPVMKKYGYLDDNNNLLI